MQVAVALRTSVGKKWLMAGSGGLLFGWLALHMLGNLGAFSGASAFDAYAASLRRIWPLLWLLRLALLAAAVIHVGAALQLVKRARAARGSAPACARPRAATFASRSMAWGGALLLAFVVFHLLHMTFGTVHPDFIAGGVYHNLVRGLAVPALAAVYVGAAALVGLHLFHGLYALPRTLGLLDSAARIRRRPVVWALAFGLSIGFAAVPLAVLSGMLR